MVREKGFYWVRMDDEWFVCMWDDGKWWWPGWEVPVPARELDEVDERRLVRDGLSSTK